MTSERIANGCYHNLHLVSGYTGLKPNKLKDISAKEAAEGAALLIDSPFLTSNETQKNTHSQSCSGDGDWAKVVLFTDAVLMYHLKDEILSSKESSVCQNPTHYWTRQPSRPHVQIHIERLSKLWMYNWTSNCWTHTVTNTMPNHVYTAAKDAIELSYTKKQDSDRVQSLAIDTLLSR